MLYSTKGNAYRGEGLSAIEIVGAVPPPKSFCPWPALLGGEYREPVAMTGAGRCEIADCACVRLKPYASFSLAKRQYVRCASPHRVLKESLQRLSNSVGARPVVGREPLASNQLVDHIFG